MLPREVRESGSGAGGVHIYTLSTFAVMRFRVRAGQSDLLKTDLVGGSERPPMIAGFIVG